METSKFNQPNDRLLHPNHSQTGSYSDFWSVTNPHNDDELREAKAWITYSNNFTMNLEWFKTMNIISWKTKNLIHKGLPHYSYLLTTHPQTHEWVQRDIMTHRPKGMQVYDQDNWDYVLYMPLSWDMWPNTTDTQPRLLYRGTITRNHTEYPLYSIHYKQGLAIPPKGTPGVVHAPMIVPDVTTPAKVILTPRIRLIDLEIDLNSFIPPKEYGCKITVTGQAELAYSSPVRIGRKPLQIGILLGGMMAGAILGGIMGGGVSAAMLEPIKAEIHHIQQVNHKSAQAMAATSRAIDALHLLTSQMQLELNTLKDSFNHATKVIATHTI